MTRFWLTLDDAVGHVLHAVGDLRGGEVFVPDLKAASLLRVATALLPNYTDAPNPEDQDLTPESAPNWITTSGIRPGGEKLHEELLSSDELRRAVKRNGFYVVPPVRTVESWDAAPWLGQPIQDGLTYRSDTWVDRWTVDELREVLARQC
mgnify:FL=1